MSLMRLNTDPTPSQLRVFGVLWLIFFGFFAYTIWARFESPIGALIVGTIAVFVPLVGLVVAPVLRWAFIGLSVLAFPIGLVISYVLITLVYFVVVTPIGIVMRLFGYDPMTRKIDENVTSYWISRPQNTESKSYFRQF